MTDMNADEWDETKVSGAEMKRRQVEEKVDLPAGPSYTNDHGIRYLIGDSGEEYLKMHGDIPENTC